MKQKKRKDDPNKLPENFRKLILAEDYDSIRDIFKTRSLEAVYGYEDITAVFLPGICRTKWWSGWQSRGRI